MNAVDRFNVDVDRFHPIYSFAPFEKEPWTPEIAREDQRGQTWARWGRETPRVHESAGASLAVTKTAAAKAAAGICAIRPCSAKRLPGDVICVRCRNERFPIGWWYFLDTAARAADALWRKRMAMRALATARAHGYRTSRR